MLAGGLVLLVSALLDACPYESLLFLVKVQFLLVESRVFWAGNNCINNRSFFDFIRLVTKASMTLVKTLQELLTYNISHKLLRGTPLRTILITSDVN